MSNRYIVMNGVTFNPTSVEYEDEKIGESLRMGDGTLRYYHRAFKGKWSISWSNVKETSVTPIRAISRLTSSFTFTDHEGNSFTVMVLPGGAKFSLSADGVDNAGVKRYNVDLTLDEV